jgi:hypothetical protein
VTPGRTQQLGLFLMLTVLVVFTLARLWAGAR